VISPRDFAKCHVGYGLLVGSFLWALPCSRVPADALPSTSDSLTFADFELELPTGLSAVAFHVPADNPMAIDKVELGRTLFFDARLSRNNTVSCATCHSPRTAFADNRRVSPGIGSQAGDRNAPTIINRAFSREQFWDGHAVSLEEQSKAPLTDPSEMGMPSLGLLVDKLRAIKGYNAWFKRVFARDVHIDDLAKALAAFERTVVSGDSNVDKFGAGNQQAINESEKRGLDLFKNKARCIQCHSGFNFTDEKYHNIGIDWDSASVDLGRYTVSKKVEDIGAFKTPTLREIARTAPYMHDGSLATLEETVEFYNQGGIANPFLDVEMKRSNRTLEQVLKYYEEKKAAETGPAPESELLRLNLTKQESADLVRFLKALNGRGWQHIRAPASFPD
jgi:cytochrome c peroxidase